MAQSAENDRTDLAEPGRAMISEPFDSRIFSVLSETIETPSTHSGLTYCLIRLNRFLAWSCESAETATSDGARYRARKLA
jgi:hypothetical protein